MYINRHVTNKRLTGFSEIFLFIVVPQKNQHISNYISLSTRKCTGKSDYAYVYTLESRYADSDMEKYHYLLIDCGFSFQDFYEDDEAVQFYYYNSGLNQSVLCLYSYIDAMILVAIGRNNAYEILISG